MIIGINGYAGSGKDTVGKLIQIVSCLDLPEGMDLEDVINNYDVHQWWLEEKSNWEIKKWAGKLKTIASLLTGIPVEKFEDQEFKKTNLGPEWDMTVRDFLQKLGTDGLRTGLHENTWVNALMVDYTPITDQSYVLEDGSLFDLREMPGHPVYPDWIITDTRFPNEAQAIKDAGGIIIRVDRPGVNAINAHPSETGLDNWDFDHKIFNNSDLAGLMFTVGNILRKENLI